MLLRQLDKKLRRIEDEKFSKFKNKINSQFRIEYDPRKYQSFLDYVSSLFLVDMLNTAFTEKGINLPPYLKVLDFGAGEWRYLHSLYNFLQYYGGERKVHLTGVDIEGHRNGKSIRKLIANIDAIYLPIDGVEICEINAYKGAYDMVLMAHMLSTKDHFEQWQVKYHSPSEMIDACIKLLRKNGLFIGIAHTHCDLESTVLDHFPQKGIIYNKRHETNLGPVTETTNETLTFNKNQLILGIK